MSPELATYPGYRLAAEIISHAIWLYHVFGLSLRDVELILAEQGIGVTHERHCQVVRVVDAFERAVRNPTSLRGPLDARLLPPDPECLGAGIAVLSGGHQMPPRTEVAIDHCVGWHCQVGGFCPERSGWAKLG
ncbi:hypothetical protein GCM10011504_57300 [Siccirubricoccus deserti]|uniref:IS6 family transposase n=1 Tax=Siccirubricoccus deserti TaxID=2013562 RepID=A0A9X0UGQ7_9PROT|nr:IS6 family transposase [Siccirubricoccus deserti]GGC72255.1 hypothetical protein GCM10011504_57300 [Siccirubricoccus deserti]